MKLLVLAGGFGTRLKSIVPDLPKPLAPVSGEPFLLYLIDNWMSQGVSEFIFLLHYKHQMIEALLATLSKNPKYSNFQYKTIVEKSPLGTGGSVLNAIDQFDISKSFLLANADTWLGSGIETIKNQSINSIGAVYVQDISRYGSLKIDGLKITSFDEKSPSNASGYINSGLYHIHPEIFKKFQPGSSFSMEKDIFPELIADLNLNAVKMHTTFIDIGIPADYLTFCQWIENNKNNDI
jgi:D-glycero-alpha-D-manno-heptose 1-phosphate guanylyltransferase